MLALYFRGADILGVDTSENMLEAARERLPAARFILQDLKLWEPDEPVDLIFANAALHFSPEHEKLSAEIHVVPHAGRRARRANAQRAAGRGSCPDAHGVGGRTLGGEAGANRQDPRGHRLSRRLLRLDCRPTPAWSISGRRSMFIRSTGRKPWSTGLSVRPSGRFLDKLDEKETAAFLAQYRRELEMAYTPQADGKVLLLYPRVFFVAQR